MRSDVGRYSQMVSRVGLPGNYYVLLGALALVLVLLSGPGSEVLSI